MQLIGRNLALLEVERHQCFVDFHDLIHQRTVSLGDGGKIRFARGIEKAIDDPPAIVGGKVDRQALFSERGLDSGQETREIDIFGVDLVDDHQPAQFPLRGPVHHARSDHFDAGRSIDHDGCRLHRVERADRLADEIGKAGSVDHVHPRPLRFQMQHRRAQGMLPRPLQRIEIANGGATFNRAGDLDRPRLQQQCFGKRGLA